MSQMNSVLRGGVLAASLALGVCGASPRADAVVVNMDFGPTAINSFSYLRSPYHGVTGDTGNTGWNSPLGKSDISTGGLVFGDGTTASALSLNVGVANESTKLSILGTQPSDSSNLGTNIYNGVYSGNSPAKDAIFDKGGSGKRGVSLQISGLDAGTYDIYYVGRNTNLAIATGQQYTQTMYAGTSAATGDFDFSGYDSSVITYTSASNANNGQSTWVLGENYAMLTLTIGQGEVLNLAFMGDGVEARGFLNSLQLVSDSPTIPEPAAFSLLAIGCASALGYRGLRRR